MWRQASAPAELWAGIKSPPNGTHALLQGDILPRHRGSLPHR